MGDIGSKIARNEERNEILLLECERARERKMEARVATDGE